MNLKGLIEAIVHTADVGINGIYITPEVLVSVEGTEYKLKSVWTRGDGKVILETEKLKKVK